VARASVSIKVMLRSYVRGQDPLDDAIGWCTLQLYLGGCNLGVPFMKDTFFAVDDDSVEMALAQGGISTPGSGVDQASVVASLP
jgi:hypothetical protein